MHRPRFLSAALLAAVTIPLLAMMPEAAITQATAGAAAKTSGCTNVNTTTTIYDFDATGVPFLTKSDDHSGIGHATYTSSGNCGSTLFSGINSAGIWRLDLFNQTARTLWITPNSPINGLQPSGPPSGYYSQSVEEYSQCYDQSGNIVPFQGLINGSNNCSLGIDFQTAGTKGTKYKFVMTPHLPASAASSPATGLASVACNAISNGQCVNWTISPNTAVANANVADLFYYNQRGALIFIGQYYNTFLIQVTNP